VAARNKARADLSSVTGESINYRSQEYANQIDRDSQHYAGDDPEKQLQWQFDNAGTRRLVDRETGEVTKITGPSALGNRARNYLIDSVHGSPEEFAEAANRIESVINEQPHVYLGLPGDVQSRYTDFAHAVKRMGGGTEARVEVANRISAQDLTLTPEQKRSAQEQYKLLRRSMYGEIRNILEDTPLNRKDQGWFWFDKNAEITPQMQVIMDDLGQNYAQHLMATTGNVDPLKVMEHIGKWLPERVSLTGINKDVRTNRAGFVVDDEGNLEYTDDLAPNGLEYIVDGSDLENEVWARGMLAKDLIGERVRISGKVYEVGEYRTPEKLGPKEGYITGFQLEQYDIEETIRTIPTTEDGTPLIPINHIIVADGGGKTITDIYNIKVTVFPLRTRDQIPLISEATGKTWDWSPVSNDPPEVGLPALGPLSVPPIIEKADRPTDVGFRSFGGVSSQQTARIKF